MSCLNCEYARRAENDEYVGCCLLVKLSYDHPARFSYEGDQLFDFYEKDSICTGWVNLGYRPNETGKEGMITNYIPCFKKDDVCKHFKEKGYIGGLLDEYDY